MMNKTYTAIADMLFERESFKLEDAYRGVVRTFEPPFSISLVKANCELIARVLWHKALDTCFNFQSIAGLPRTADLFVKAIDKMTIQPKGFRAVKLAEQKGQIIFAPGFECRPSERVLLFDGLLIDRDSGIEAIKLIESQGAIVAGFVVLIDFEQSGIKDLKADGYSIWHCFTITQLLDYYKEVGMLSSLKYLDCIDYVENG